MEGHSRRTRGAFENLSGISGPERCSLATAASYALASKGREETNTSSDYQAQ